MTLFSAVELIVKKRSGLELSADEISWLVSGYVSGAVAAEQMSAFCMAVLLKGMCRAEVFALTSAMVDSGKRLELGSLVSVDKHSTGGVGDKISLILVPLVASFGVAVPQLSGRGLGHTGGTLDKLSAIHGFSADPGLFLGGLRSVGCAISAAGDDLAPADRLLYALRDVTATVESQALIAASIMSKKIAEGTGALVLDVKVGSGAFMKDIESARSLAASLVDIGKDFGIACSALLTRMSTPLGYAIGNSLEVEEALEVLAGGGPADVVELTVQLANSMLQLVGVTGVDVASALKSGKAMDKFRQLVEFQGGDLSVPLPSCVHSTTFVASASGILSKVDALDVGLAAWKLGAGRARKEDSISLGAGVKLHAVEGERVSAGDVIATLYADDQALFDSALEHMTSGIVIGDEYSAVPLILGRVS